MQTNRFYLALADYLGLGLVLASLVAFFAAKTDYFFTLTTFRTIANQIPDAVIIATGMTFVLIIAGIDLSVGSVLALGGAVFGLAMTAWGVPVFIAIPLCIAVGILCGAMNGMMVAKWRLPAFIVTLGMLEAARGGAYLVTGSKTQYIGADVEWITSRGLLGLSISFIVALAVVVLHRLSQLHHIRAQHVCHRGMKRLRVFPVLPVRIKMLAYTLCGGSRQQRRSYIVPAYRSRPKRRHWL